jgi:hypothetical protein
MQLTPEQQEQVRQAKERGERRAHLSLTTEQKAAWRQAVEQELAGKEENIAFRRKIVAAADQPGFFGDIRRAILLSRRVTDELSAAIGVDPRMLSDFRAGDSDLPSAALERLIDALGLRLMQEIPR